MALYHSTLGFPRMVKGLPNAVQLVYTAHAKSAAETDRYCRMSVKQLPDLFMLAEWTIVEMEVEGNTFLKGLFRQPSPYSGFDLSIVVLRDKRSGYVVKTVWLNESNDTHTTLDVKRYSRVS